MSAVTGCVDTASMKIQTSQSQGASAWKTSRNSANLLNLRRSLRLSKAS